MTSPPIPVEPDDLARRFQHHPPPDRLTERAHAHVRDVMLRAARELVAVVPPGREASQAVAACELAMMHGNAGVARRGGPAPGWAPPA